MVKGEKKGEREIKQERESEKERKKVKERKIVICGNIMVILYFNILFDAITIENLIFKSWEPEALFSKHAQHKLKKVYSLLKK